MRNAVEDSANTKRVGDGLVQPVGLWDVEVGERRCVTANRDHVHDSVGSFERGAAIDRYADGRTRAVLVCRESRDLLGGRQPRLVDVVEREFDLTQLGEREQVTHEVARELDRPGPDERHSEHVVRPYRIDRVQDLAAEAISVVVSCEVWA